MPVNDLRMLFGKEVVVSKIDLLRMYIEIACWSDNPTIVDAIENLMMMVKIAEPDAVQEALFQATVYSGVAEVRRQQIDLEEAHEIVDEVIEKGDTNSIFALDNLIDVARTQRPFKKKSR